MVNIKRFVNNVLFNEKALLKKDNSYPKISVITPSFNQGKFLERTILSILNQNYPNLEYIIIDGGSTDNSVEIIKKYEKYISHWISEKDRGQVDAINKGLKLATGDLVAWQNSDDIYLPDVFFKVAKIYQKNKEHDLFYGYVYLIDEDDKVINDFRFSKFNLNSFLYLAEFFCYNQSTFFKRELIQNYGFLDERYQICFDYDFFIRLGKVAKFYLIREYIGCYRIHPNRKTEKTDNTIGINEQRDVQLKNKVNLNKYIFNFKRTIYLLRKFLFLSLWGDFDYIKRKVIKSIFSLIFRI